MSTLHTNEFNALKLLMTEDIYILDQKAEHPENSIKTEKPTEPDKAVQAERTMLPEIPAALPVPEPAEIKKAKEFTYLGENNKYFLILIDDTKNREISSLHKETLLKIMSAKGLELRDLAILNLDQFPDTTISEIKEFFSCSKLVLFGINPQRIALPGISSNKVENHANVKLFSTFSIDEMISDVTKKKEFWAIMKEF
ncbi:hypothetical protein SAMN05421813_12453 [Daejeonella rubra]|uniref:DNA polymerase III psi subunit n=1 Tax=Daejeonella rubra TaxID=990371 RepID=A0A1G9WCM4_9SPHI|nr:hypothetical protein [Daejeonella rubra]SDM81961.1 hypothetical protein SAMN05421813_12453 [Daejeonella rubra]